MCLQDIGVWRNARTFREVEPVVLGGVLHEWQQHRDERPRVGKPRIEGARYNSIATTEVPDVRRELLTLPDGKRSAGIHMEVTADGELLDLRSTCAAPRAFPSRLHGREEQSDEQADDGDHNQKFDKREAGAPAVVRRIAHSLHGSTHFFRGVDTISKSNRAGSPGVTVAVKPDVSGAR